MAMDPETALAFAIQENPGVFALLLGSGLSRAAEIQTGYEITLDLVRKIATAEGVPEQPDWDAWYRKDKGQAPEYSRLLDELAQTPHERRAILHSYIEPSPDDLKAGRRIPTKAHRAIAKLVSSRHVRIVLTTNFDRLTETALREAGVEPTIIASEDDLRGATPLEHSRCWVVKLHGDYLDTRIRNTQEELDSYPNVFDELLDRIIDEHGLVVCGWSAEWDGALRAAIKRAPNRRYSMFWAARNGKVRREAEDLITLRSGRLLAIKDADSFFEELESKVSVLASLNAPNPKNTDLLIARVKRYIAEPAPRIELNDVVRREIGHLLGSLASTDLSQTAQFSSSEFVRRVSY